MQNQDAAKNVAAASPGLNGSGQRFPQAIPSVVWIMADQWRGQAFGYAGDRNAGTPVVDRLARQSVNFVNAVSGYPLCCPARASLMTGQYATRHGVLFNDAPLCRPREMLADVFHAHGYDTAYIGKWHIAGSPAGNMERRGAYLPPAERGGFAYWKALECGHDYLHSGYYADDDPERKYWPGYDAFAQTQDACAYLRDPARAAKPFLLCLSFGPPHEPYDTAPAEFRALYSTRAIELRPNVPAACQAAATWSLRGYYAHIAALDQCVGQVLEALRQAGLDERTIVVFTSDHGDMHGSQGILGKHVPWDESIRTPFLVRCPAASAPAGRTVATPIDTPDFMPTLLGLCGLPIPSTVQGQDFSTAVLRGAALDRPALLNVPVPTYTLTHLGIPEYRGVRTARYTYVATRRGPWLLYDNDQDPYQQTNLMARNTPRQLAAQLGDLLADRLSQVGDRFADGASYVAQFGLGRHKIVAASSLPEWSGGPAYCRALSGGMLDHQMMPDALRPR